MRSINQQATPQFQEMPSFPDQLEAVISEIECRLLETLTPQQFQMVQHLVEATQLLTELEATVGSEMFSARKSA